MNGTEKKLWCIERIPQLARRDEITVLRPRGAYEPAVKIEIARGILRLDMRSGGMLNEIYAVSILPGENRHKITDGDVLCYE